MAEAFPEESGATASPVVLANYPGPKSDTQYPLHVQYCGGSFFFFFVELIFERYFSS